MDDSLSFAVRSIQGRVRGHNEDAVLACPEQGVWAVADGMGGHRCGEVASALALNSLALACAEGHDLEESVHAANQAVMVASERRPQCRGMGTTLVAVRFRGADFQIAWVGDSRAYRVGPAGIDRLTHDHSWVQAMMDAGQLNAEQAREHPRRSVLLRCLGQVGSSLEVESIRGRLDNDELLLLCSDGLTGELDDADLHRHCCEPGTLAQRVDRLVDLADERGGRDNISCIVLGRALEVPAPPKWRTFLDGLLRPLR